MLQYVVIAKRWSILPSKTIENYACCFGCTQAVPSRDLTWRCCFRMLRKMRKRSLSLMHCQLDGSLISVRSSNAKPDTTTDLDLEHRWNSSMSEKSRTWDNEIIIDDKMMQNEFSSKPNNCRSKHHSSCQLTSTNAGYWWILQYQARLAAAYSVKYVESLKPSVWPRCSSPRNQFQPGEDIADTTRSMSCWYFAD